MSNVAEHLPTGSEDARPLHRVLHDVRVKSSVIRRRLALGKITPEEAEEQLERLRNGPAPRAGWFKRFMQR